MKKQCGHCKLTKPVADFAYDVRSRDGFYYKCRLCCAAWNRRNRDARRAAKLKLRYGLTADEFQRLLVGQAGKCAICETSEPGGRYSSFCVDHNHVTGEVRGLLCSSCNMGLGIFNDDLNLVVKVVCYLQGQQ